MNKYYSQLSEDVQINQLDYKSNAKLGKYDKDIKLLSNLEWVTNSNSFQRGKYYSQLSGNVQMDKLIRPSRTFFWDRYV